MSADNPTTKERLATLEAQFKALDKYVRNDLGHRVGRVEIAVYMLVLGGGGTLLAYILERVSGD